MNKSGFMQVVRKNMPDPYAGLSKEEITIRKNFLIEEAHEKVYESLKSIKRRAKALRASKLAEEYRKLKFKRAKELR
jgi:hypothetical protein